MIKKRETKKESRHLKIYQAYQDQLQKLRAEGKNPSLIPKKTIYLDVSEQCDCSQDFVRQVICAQINKEKSFDK